MALSDSRPTRRLCDVGVASPSRDGSPPMTRITLPTCRASYPGGSRRVHVSIASPLTRPSPFPRRVGIRIFTFEASSGFTRVTARWIAQPPKAAFVTRLRPGRLPRQAARQLPDQSTTLWMEPSSIGDTRRRGARRVEDGRGSLGLVWQRSVSRPRSSNRTCGLPASGFPTGFSPRHTAGTEFGVCCRSSGRWQTRPAAPIGVHLRRRLKLLQKRPDAQGCSRLIANHRPSAPSKAHQKQGPFPPPALPGLHGRTALSDSRPTRRLCGVGVASPSRDGSPPMTRITFPTCRAPYPGGSRRVHVSISSPLTRPSPFPRRVGIRIFTFEACSGFTRVTARWIAQPPKAAFVTRLRPGRLPRQAARQLPEQSTTLRVEPSSTGDTRRRGALGNPGFNSDRCHPAHEKFQHF